MPQNDKNVILPVTFNTFRANLSRFFKIFHKIWKILIFLPHISCFMTYHPKIHNKVSKINNKLCKPIFCPFWTPGNVLKLKYPPTKILVFAIKWLVNDHWKMPQCLFAWPWHNFLSPKNRPWHHMSIFNNIKTGCSMKQLSLN